MPFPTATRPGGSVSSSAPPSYRAKKKKPGTVDSKGHAETAGEFQPRGQNDGRMTGPPMQMGPGQGSMFANGRMGVPQGNVPRTPNYPTAGPGPSRVSGQPQSSVPPGTPNYPTMGPGPRGVRGQAQGAVPPTPNYPTMANGRPRMMADGGMIGDTSPIGDEPDADDMPPQGDADQPPQGGGGLQMGGAVVSPGAVQYHDDPQMCSGCAHFGQDGQCEILQMQVSPQGGCTAFEAGGGGDQGLGGPTGADITQNPEGTSGGPSLT